ncbi:hypothetical protein [Solimonas marina]|uniref:DUF3185 domain-containing protein n=1 Tax=Solimonas marina TaxID=2714601 RepID=A0A969W7V4_9GAMM|nr:hypothetical protein [Solimonas marina]NKF21108.1 hypothetical protein [Solimonas marina]
MGVTKIIGIVLIVLGAAGLAYKQFSYTKETHDANIGDLHLAVKEKQHVAVPTWLGGAAVVLGIVLLVVPSRKS